VCLNSGKVLVARVKLPLGMLRQILIGKSRSFDGFHECWVLILPSHCIPIANNGGVFKLGGGVASVLINCAEDQVP
jgi:hypothetical protein